MTKPLRLLCLSLLPLLFLGGTCFADDYQIPITIARSGLIHLKASVNGVPATFLLDTTLRVPLVLNASRQRALHFQREGARLKEATVTITGTGASFTLSPESIADATVSDDASRISYWTKENADGVVGIFAFKDYSIDLNCPKRLVALHSDSFDIKGKDIHMAYANINQDGILADFSVGNDTHHLERAPFLFNTGVNRVLLSRETLKGLGVVTKIQNRAFKGLPLNSFKVKACTVAGSTKRDYTAFEAPGDVNILGMPFLSRQQVIISANRQSIIVSNP